MAITAKKLARGPLPIVIATAYTVPASFRTFVKDIDICNTTGAPLSVFVHLVPSGIGPSAETQLLPGVVLQANDMVHWSGLQVLDAGDTIQTVASLAGASMHISGAEESV